MENELTLKVKRRQRKEKKDMVVTVSGEVYEALKFYSSETDIPIKMLADTLLRYALDNIKIVYEDGNEVS